jgi:hypothetical protein
MDDRTKKILISAAVGAGLGLAFGKPAYAAIKKKITSMDAPPLGQDGMKALQTKLNWFCDMIAGIPGVGESKSGLTRVRTKSSGGYDGQWGPNTMAATHSFHDLLVKAAENVDASNLNNYTFMKYMAGACGGLSELADQDKAAVALSKYDGRMSNYDLRAFGKALGVNVDI